MTWGILPCVYVPYGVPDPLSCQLTEEMRLESRIVLVKKAKEKFPKERESHFTNHING